MTLDDLIAAPCGARLEPIAAGRTRYVKGGTGRWLSATGSVLSEELRGVLHSYRLITGSPSPRRPRQQPDEPV